MNISVISKCALAFSLTVAAASAASAQILFYDFNQTGSSVSSSGSADYSLTMRDSNGDIADLHSAEGGGVSGASDDRAFDNTAASGMGSAGQKTGGYAYTSSAISSTIGGLESFTVTGWFKSDSVIDNAAGLVKFTASGSPNAGVYVYASNTGRLTLQVNDINGSYVPNSDYSITDEWVFFAITYDGTKTSDNVDYYIGTSTESVSLAYTATLDAGTVVAANTGLSVTVSSRPYDGYMDDIGLYGSYEDDSGVLSMEALEDARAASVPEPSSSSLCLGALILLAIGYRRLCRRD